MNWCKKEKKCEISSECFTHGSGKTIRVFNQVLSKMSWATKLKFSSTILLWCSYFIRVTKMKRNTSQLFKETTWVVTTVCHRSTCKYNNMQTLLPCFFDIDLDAYSTFMGSFLLVRAVDQQQKQLAVRFYSRWYIIRSAIDILAMKRVVELKIT